MQETKGQLMELVNHTSIAKAFYLQAAYEVSKMTHYWNEVIQLNNLNSNNHAALGYISCLKKCSVNDVSEINLTNQALHYRSGILLNGNLNYSLDIQGLLTDLYQKSNRSTRIISITYNSYYKTIFYVASKLGLIQSKQIQTFITQDSLENLARLTQFEIVKVRHVGIFPFKLFGIGNWISRFICSIPFIRSLAPACVIVLRPIKPIINNLPSLSIVIPARNEEGNVPFFLSRLPNFGSINLEVIVVEGNSTDQTWAAIQNLVKNYSGPIKLKSIKQSGKGKNNAVREGFEQATGDLITILDADLTMPPEDLLRFYQAYVIGLGDFVNGSRLVYPMEGQAMRFLNKLGNVFFVKALNFTLENSISDSLCGTKLMLRADYERLKKWRHHFGDFDPFGDFELIFFATLSGLGIIDVPVYYRARTYGETNIRRFRDGLILLKMTLIGLFKIRI